MSASNADEILYASNEPYPEIQISQKNLRYARWMLDNMGGLDSEMSTISLYIYNNIICGENFQELSNIFQKISVVEMHHLKIFGKLSFLLGENPRLWTKRGNRAIYWTPNYNHYTLELSRLMHNALNKELMAIRKYEQQICAIKQENIVENLKRIIQDEKIHVSILQKIIIDYHL